jgi:hypothetical protein
MAVIFITNIKTLHLRTLLGGMKARAEIRLTNL